MVAELDRCIHEMLPGQCAICNQRRGGRASEHDLEQVLERFRAAEVEDLLRLVRERAARHGLVERPWVRALMFTPGLPVRGPNGLHDCGPS
jgi:hypothetical protein